MDRYRKMSPDEQCAVRMGCRLLQEADQIGNLKGYESLLAQSNKPKILVCADLKQTESLRVKALWMEGICSDKLPEVVSDAKTEFWLQVLRRRARIHE